MSLGKQLMSGVFFTAISKYVNIFVSLLVTSILARLISPEQFGVVAIATVVISFLIILADIGLTSTIIQYKSLTDNDLSKLFSLSLYLAIILSCLVFFGADYLAEYYDNPQLKPICKWLCIHLFFTTLSVVPNAIFYKEKLFKQLAIRGFIVQVLAAIVSVSWAFYYRSVYALVVSPVLSSILLFAISYSRFPLRFQWRFSIDSITYTFKYSLYQFLFDIINFFSRNVDTLFIGKTLGVAVLGYYDKAYRLMLLPLRNITQVITPVLHPLLSSHSDDKKYLMTINETMCKLLALIGFPMSVWLFFTSEELILFFFGNQWQGAVPAFKILSLTVGLQMISACAGSFFQIGGDTRSLFISGLFAAVLNLLAVLFGTLYFKSIEMVAAGLLVTYLVCFFQSYWLLYDKIFKENSFRFFKIFIKPILFSILIALIYLGLIKFFRIDGAFLSFAWKTILYIVSMVIIVFLGGYKAEIVQLIKQRQLPKS